MNSPSVAVILVAAGSGSRLGLSTPKAFVAIGSRTIFERALDEVFGMANTPQVIAVVAPDRVGDAKRLTAGTEALVVVGGETRQQSVAAGIAVLGPEIRTVLVHDAARALTPTWLLDAVAAEVERQGHGVIPGLRVVNTIKQTDDSGLVIANIDRGELRAVQTPQGFPRELLVAAYETATEDFTDDAALFTAAGHPVSIIDGDPLAFKITTPWDLRRAEQLVAESARNPREHSSLGAGVAGSLARSPQFHRAGIGVDIHAFDDSCPLWLGGLYWPDEPGLAGHSDGDAISHAICDALLSAAGLGDLGSRFGTDDPRREGAHGDVFITESIALVTGAGYSVENIAVQLIANRPKLGPRRSEMESQLSSLVGAPVSVSATTSDGLGFTGTGAGVWVIANCLLATR